MADDQTDKLLRLEIITPQRSVYSGNVESFSAPGTSGGFQVLHNHAPFLTTIGVGEVSIREEAGGEFQYSTTGGFVEVSNNHVTFLADTAERKDEIDIERARAARARAEQRLDKKEPGIDVDRARIALARAMNRLRIADAL